MAENTPAPIATIAICPYCAGRRDVSHRMSGDTVYCSCGGWFTVYHRGAGAVETRAAGAPDAAGFPLVDEPGDDQVLQTHDGDDRPSGMDYPDDEPGDEPLDLAEELDGERLVELVDTGTTLAMQIRAASVMRLVVSYEKYTYHTTIADLLALVAPLVELDMELAESADSPNRMSMFQAQPGRAEAHYWKIARFVADYGDRIVDNTVAIGSLAGVYRTGGE